MEFDKDILATHFDREPFSFRHSLSNNPLLQLDTVKNLAGRLEARPGELYGDLDVTSVGQRWAESTKPAGSFVSLVDQIAFANAWIIIRHAELDPRYRALLTHCMREIKESGARLPVKTRKENAIIFVTSPNRISTYHIDRECNFILQIRGEKRIYIFDRNDRQVLPEEELEHFWAVDNNAAKYKPQFQDRARVFHLRPGDGVHVPVNAPHWVQNGDEVSITLSLNFQFDELERANKYRANYYLRRLGLSPAPPGRHPRIDSLKANAIRCAVGVGRPLKSLFRS